MEMDEDKDDDINEKPKRQNSRNNTKYNHYLKVRKCKQHNDQNYKKPSLK